MARSSADNQAIYEKVQYLMTEGYPENQATAIAFRMFRDNELVSHTRRLKEIREKRDSQKRRARRRRRAKRSAILKGIAQSYSKMTKK
tara:strand:+ start:383 stop:646 length:264 start_codon:yes stop_codon:yes gene_type:complete